MNRSRRPGDVTVRSRPRGSIPQPTAGPADGSVHGLTRGPQLSLDLPDPESDSLSTMEFLARLEEAWAVCDRFDLQTEIWRGRILCSVRDRERRGGEGRGTGFLQWLREREISKTRAYTLIQLAESADGLVGEGLLEEGSVNNFSKRAFLETAQADHEVQQMISEAANEGQQITRKQVRRLTDEFTAATSPLLPEEIRQRTADNLLPPGPWRRWCGNWPSCPRSSRTICAVSCGKNPSWSGLRM